MPLRASIIYFNYLSNSNCELKSYEYVSDGIFLFNQNKIKTNFFVRTMSTFNKLLFNIEKGNFDFLSNFGLYLNNFIKGENKVK